MLSQLFFVYSANPQLTRAKLRHGCVNIPSVTRTSIASPTIISDSAIVALSCIAILAVGIILYAKHFKI